MDGEGGVVGSVEDVEVGAECCGCGPGGGVFVDATDGKGITGVKLIVTGSPGQVDGGEPVLLHERPERLDVVVELGEAAAGIDACLHVVRRELGSQVASYIARRMVVPPQRDGGQRQYVDTPLPPSPADSLAPLLQWLTENLEQPHTMASMAAQVHLSVRTFTRRFHAETGTSPHQWLTAQRVDRARRLLEDTDNPIQDVARRCGFGSTVTLRNHFRAALGSTPTAYRTRFTTRIRHPQPATPSQQVDKTP